MSTQLQAALRQLADGDVRVLAGGTDVFTLQWPARQQFINVANLTELKTIEEHEDYWRIGAAVTWSELANTQMPAQFDALIAAGKEVGSIQIQNTATVVGNVCNASPAADGTPALLAMNAQIEIASIDGRKVFPIQDFVLGPREIALTPIQLVVAIRIPKLAGTTVSAFQKLGSRKYLVISFVSVAAVITVDKGTIVSAAIAIGSCSPVAMRMQSLEAKLVGQSPDLLHSEDLVAESDLQRLAPIDDKRATAAYRMSAAKVLVQRTLKSLSAPHT